jgi:hypothetical protein
MAPQVLPTAITKVHPAWQSGWDLTDYIYKKSILTFGSISGEAPCWDVALDSTGLTWEHPSTSRACEVRHITASFPESVQEEEALRRLPKIAGDWIKKYAPDRNWIAGIHKDNGKFHVHLAVQNVKDGKPLRLLPHMVLEMSRMGYTDQARDAKGVGSPGLKFYSKTAKPLLADVIRSATKEQLHEWIEAGQLRPGRRDKAGIITSIEWDSGDGKKPRRIRLDTLRRLTLRQAAAPGGDSGQPQGTGPGEPVRLPRRRQPRSHERSARPRRERHLCRDVDRRHQQDSSLVPQRRPYHPQLFRDQLPGSKLAAAARPGPVPGAGRLAPAPIRGLAHFTSLLTPKKKDTPIPAPPEPLAALLARFAKVSQLPTPPVQPQPPKLS